MITADIAVFALIALFALIGFIFGFGKGLKFITGGIFGVIISIVICYVISGFVLEISFVNDFAVSINNKLAGIESNFFTDLLLKINVGFIAVYVIMFIVVQIIRIIIVNVLKSVFEINNVFIKAVNKTLGIGLYVAIFFALMLFVFQIIAWVGGSSAEGFRALLDGSVIKLDWIFDNNPLKSIMEIAQGA